jgi:hypothetical protein
MIVSRFAFSLTLFEIAMLAVFIAAMIDKSFFLNQIPQIWYDKNPGKKFLPLWDNWTFRMSVFVACPVAAYLLAWHASSWPLPWFAVILEVVWIGGAFGLLGLLEDSKTNWGGLFQNGKLTLAGGMYQMMIWPLQLAIYGTFYLFTPKQEMTTREIVIVTILLIATWLTSTLQPPKKLHGEINSAAGFMAGAGTLVLVGLAVYRINFG